MIRNFSRMLDLDEYIPMSSSRHSELRASEELQESDVSSISEHSTLDLDVRYTFTDDVRNNQLIDGRKYSSRKAFILIYQELVKLNNGVSFIDTYFEEIFPSYFKRNVRAESRELLIGINNEYEEILQGQRTTKSGEYDKRTREYRKLRNFSVWKEETTKDRFDDLSIQIKNHIRQCLATGRIPLYFHAKQGTVDRRKQLGLFPMRAFFATGQLIDNLVISYNAELKR